jgi:hypothetical protein
MHGGATPAVKAQAQRAIVWQQAQGGIAELLQECDLPEQHPLDGLLEVVRHSGAMMRMLGYVVAGLELDKEGTANTKKLVGFDRFNEQTANAYVELYGQWSDRYARACKLALDANIDERLIRNAEATTTIFVEAMEDALKEANLDPAQAARFSKALADRLRKLAGPLDTRVGRAELDSLI